VRVRSPQQAHLAEALQREGIAATASNEHALLVHGATAARVGDIAFAAGIPVHELVTEGSSLEEVFLDLTAEVQS
jgi:ABC-2 type transport system ATP-binding protein